MNTPHPACKELPKLNRQFSLRTLLITIGALCVCLTTYRAYGIDSLFAWWLVLLGVGFVVACYYRRVAYALGLIPIASFSLCAGAVVNMDSIHDARLAECRNNMKNLTLALHMHDGQSKKFPTAYEIQSPPPLAHSWRVMILPFIEEDALFRKFNLAQPWNSPTNLPLGNTQIQAYHCPADDRPRNHASYFAVVGDDTAWPPGRSISHSDIKDDKSNTIMLVEQHESGVVWSEPRDLEASNMSWHLNAAGGNSISSGHGPRVTYLDGSQRFTGPRPATIGMADGSVHALNPNIDPTVLKQLLNRHDGEPMDNTW